MLKWWRDWRDRRGVRKAGFTSQQWESAVADWPVVRRYQGAEREALRALSFRFLVRKKIVPGGDFQITDAMRLKIAAMACVPVLHLGLDWYDHWYTVILYEGDFVPNRPYLGPDGVVHSRGPGLSGEAWYRGPVILSWQTICESIEAGRYGKAGNVVIHELAHKLDMLRNGANGEPPIHPGMHPADWHDIFTNAWDRLQSDWQHHLPLPIDDYALTSPAEFFAVCSEVFFEAPQTLQYAMPDVYRLLCEFYRQQPGPHSNPPAASCFHQDD